MDNNARLQLNKMIKANDVEDQTGLIRELKHSDVLRDDVNALIMLKHRYANDPETLINESMTQCNFLFTYYTDIYNKVRKDEIDLNILFRFLDVLRQIENKELDQHEGSFVVGTLLKELYVDSALKKADKINAEHAEEPIKYVEPLDINWKQFNTMQGGISP